jgi:rfaE bifunctional protein kinase chain/domain
MATLLIQNEIKSTAPFFKKERRVIYVSGVFNILHPGHLRLLQFAKECGDILVVGVIKNPATQEFISADLRLEAVKVLGFVDYVFMQEVSPGEIVEKLKPYAVVKGKEHEHKFNVELSPLKAFGGKLIFGSGDISFASHQLLSLEFQELNLSTIKVPEDFMARHNFTRADLTALLGKFSGLKVCVIGDIIVDEYVACTPLGMSQEDPTIVVSPLQTETFVGGAAIVAAHARTLGANVHFFSVAGKDNAKEFTEKHLEKLGIKYTILDDESRPTTLKQRYRVGNKTLLRVSHLRQHDISEEIVDVIFSEFSKSCAGFDAVIFSDFNYGILTQPLVDKITALCRKNKIFMVADSQSSSQIGDVSRFKHMNYITPTEREARLATRDFVSGLVILAEKLRQQAHAQQILITLGADGVLIHSDSDQHNHMLTDKLPTFNDSPKDVAGAGDSLLITAALASVAGASIWQAAFLGSIAAACQVGRIGNMPLRYDEILQEINL